MGLIQDLRAAGLTVILRGVDRDPEKRGRIFDVHDIEFAPTRTAPNSRGEMIARYEDQGDVTGLIDAQGRVVLFNQGPLPPKREDHPNRRRSALFLLVAPRIADFSPVQVVSRGTVRTVCRALYGPPGPRSNPNRGR